MDRDEITFKQSLEQYLGPSHRDVHFVPSDAFWNQVTRPPRRARSMLWGAAVAALVALIVVGPGLTKHPASNASSRAARFPVPLMGFRMVTMQNGWAEGLNDTLYVTKSGGQSWIPLVRNAGTHGLFPVGPSTLWYLGKISGSPQHYRMAVWRTTNLGRTWQETSVPLAWVPQVMEIWAENSHQALVTVASQNHGSSQLQMVFRVTGKTLSPSVVLPPTLVPANRGIDLATSGDNGQQIWLSTVGPSSLILWSIRQGRLTRVALPPANGTTGHDTMRPVGSVQSPTAHTSFLAVNDQPQIVPTRNSWGALYRWSLGHWVLAWKTRGIILQSQFVSGQVGWILMNKEGSRGLYTMMLHTTNGGKSFSSLPMPPHGSFSFINARDGWSYLTAKPGHPTMWQTTDGGKNWTRFP